VSNVSDHPACGTYQILIDLADHDSGAATITIGFSDRSGRPAYRQSSRKGAGISNRAA
jgi:hypothetical protein